MVPARPPSTIRRAKLPDPLRSGATKRLNSCLNRVRSLRAVYRGDALENLLCLPRIELREIDKHPGSKQERAVGPQFPEDTEQKLRIDPTAARPDGYDVKAREERVRRMVELRGPKPREHGRIVV